MKRIIIFSALLFCFSIFGSVAISNYGVYENRDIKFVVNYTWGNSTPTPTMAGVHFNTITFKILSKKGYTIYNKSYFVFQDRSYIFNSSNTKNYLYKEGYRRLSKTRLTNNSIVKIVYYVLKKKHGRYFTTRKVEKRFKIVLPKTYYKSQNKIKLIEL